jgi:formylglycine-generating enzyme required for sulfatase activity
MGSPADEEDRDSGETLHEVTLTQGFWMARHPVTQGQWQSLMGDSPSHFQKAGNDAPVESVNWDDAMRFCRRLTEHDAEWRYRLPTEAQWEYACRAGTTGPYNARAAVIDLMWYEGNSGGTTHPVGEKRPNAWGIHDMHGNVWEWCADWYGSYPAEAVTDPTGAQNGEYRVLRGGCWEDPAQGCRSAIHLRGSPDGRDNGIGFRPVRMRKA